MAYLLSIVVPTKDRYPYLKYLIELVNSFNSDEIELIVQDNTEKNDEIVRFIEELQYQHLKYFHIKEQISVSANADQAILNSSGEYVCFIGDDDGVTRFVLDAVKWMKENGYHILKSSYSIFKWPSFRSPKHYDVNGRVHYNDYHFTFKEIDCKSSLSELLKNGVESLGNMPKVYNGIVKRSVLDEIYSKCNTFMPGPSPDMANAVALAVIEDKFAYVDAPVIIGGHSGHLGGDAGKYKKGLGPLDDQPFISKEAKDNWSPRIPKVWASRTVWPESARTALVAFGCQNYLDEIDYEVIQRKFIVDHWEYAQLALSLSDHRIKLFWSSLYHFCIKKVFERVSYYNYKKHNLFGGLKVRDKADNIIEAEKLFCRDIEEFRLERIEQKS